MNLKRAGCHTARQQSVDMITPATEKTPSVIKEEIVYASPKIDFIKKNKENIKNIKIKISKRGLNNRLMNCMKDDRSRQV